MSVKVSIAVLSWNSKMITQDCLDSIIQNVTGCSYQLLVIENGSKDGSAEMLQERYPAATYPQINLIYNDTNLGFAGGNNQAFSLAAGEYFLLLNSDTIVPPDAIEGMVDWLDQHSAYGGATTTLLNRDQTIQYYMHRRWPTAARLILSLVHKRWPQFKPQPVRTYLYLDYDFKHDRDVAQAAGACLLVRSSIIKQFGQLLDDKHFPLYYNDVDLCYRLWQAGWKIRCLSAHPITHLKGTSVRTLSWVKNGKEYSYASLWWFKKHGRRFDFWILRCFYLAVFIIVLPFAPIRVARILKTIFTLQR